MRRFLLTSTVIGVSLVLLSLMGCGSSGSSAKVSWKTQYEQGNLSINGIFALDENHVWAVGTLGIILFFDGSSWAIQRDPLYNISNISASTPSFNNLHSVCAIDENHVWAVGDNGTILFFDGSSWNEQDSSMGETLKPLVCVAALDNKHVWAIGARDTILFFNGTAWASTLSDTGQKLNGVSSANTNLTWAVGSGSKASSGIILQNNGTAWKEKKDTTSWLNSVYALDDSHAWAVGGNGTILFGNGDTWVDQRSSSAETLTSVWGVDTNNVWAVGLNGTTLKYDGTTWTSQQNPLSGTRKILTSVTAADANHVWAVGSDPSGGGGVILVLSPDR